jgi:hypothetical protein
MKTKLLAVLLLAGSSLFAGPRISFGVGISSYGPAYYAPPPPPPPPPPIVAYAPPCPGPGYNWVAGFWYPVGPRYSWRAGYWARPSYYGERWVAPRRYERSYYRGNWRR